MEGLGLFEHSHVNHFCPNTALRLVCRLFSPYFLLILFEVTKNEVSLNNDVLLVHVSTHSVFLHFGGPANFKDKDWARTCSWEMGRKEEDSRSVLE